MVHSARHVTHKRNRQQRPPLPTVADAMGEPSEPTGAILLSEQDELPPTGFFEEVDLSPHRLDQPEVPAAAVAVVALLALVIMWRKRHRCLGRGYQKTATATPPPTRGRATRARRQRSPSPEDDEEMG